MEEKDTAAMITAAWSEFVAAGSLDNHTISEEILESWSRCRDARVDPYDGFCYNHLNRTDFKILLDKRKELLETARPFMVKLYNFVKGSGFIVMLTDEQGFILEALGDKETLVQGEDIKFIRGAAWTEEEVGTNAIGTALILKRPLQVTGAEHYCLKHHCWTCSAAPIFDENGQVIGILDMSGPVKDSHLHTLGMVVAAVEAIMDQMRIHEQNRQLTMANYRMNNVFQNISDGVIHIDSEGVILQTNPVAKQIIGKPDREVVGCSIREILGKGIPALEKTIKLKSAYNDMEVIVDTANGRVHCVSSGIPIRDDGGNVTDVVILVRPIENVHKLVNRFSGAQATFHFKDIVGRSPKMEEAIGMASLAALGGSNILLEGESGTGKEIFAQSIHNRSPRSNGPFVAVNCGAIPRELLGSELFGYADGAFTGAKRGGRPGKFEMASGGTLFLDEIGDMPLDQQVSLLRVLQDKQITRIGDNKIIPVDFRLICATNKNLLEQVEKGDFRQDLYYRLNVVSIYIPALREHREDILQLFEHFLESIGREWGSRIIDVEPEIPEYLQQYDWPGNVRELQNVVQRLISLAEDGHILVAHLPSVFFNKRSKQPLPELASDIRPVKVHLEREKKKKMVADNECRKIIELLAKHGGTISNVAKDMGVSRNTVYRKMRQYNIDY